ncbi:MAG: hypothetical protein HY305_03130 [Sphingobacteriales bacterium]|nr:hypothetical protein [Sphingobacteriales bacterium]
MILLLSAGMITGYADILPLFVRGEKISLAASLAAPTTLASWTSILIPFATTKNDVIYNTDPSMRNCYFSIALLLFLVLSLVRKKNRWQQLLLVIGVAFMLLSTGGIFKTFAYKFVPFIGYVRLNGEFRIFSLLCFIVVAAIEVNKYIQQKEKFTGTVTWIYYLIEIITFIVIGYGLYKTFTTKDSMLFLGNKIFTEQGITGKLKSLIDIISFYDTLWIQGIIQLLFLWGIKWCLKYSNGDLLMKLIVMNMIIASLLPPPPALPPPPTPMISTATSSPQAPPPSSPGDLNDIKINTFSPNEMNISLFANNASQLILQQNNYPHWYYKNEGKKKMVNQWGINFMSVPIVKGKNTITFLFQPTLVKWMMLLSFATLITCCFSLFILKNK